MITGSWKRKKAQDSFIEFFIIALIVLESRIIGIVIKESRTLEIYKNI